VSEFPLMPISEPDIAALERAAQSLSVMTEVQESAPPPIDSGDRVKDAVAKAWVQILGRPSLDSGERWDEAGGDSLKALRLWVVIEQALEVQLPFETFDERATPVDLTNTIARLLATSTRPAARKPTVSAVADFICLNRRNQGDDDDNSPIFCLPTVSGSTVAYLHLAKLLGPHHPVHGIEFVEGTKATGFKPFASLREMAAAIVPGFLSERNRPVCLLGYSYAGLLAIEVALQLERYGQSVPLVAMVDTMPPAASFPPLFRVAHFATKVGPWARRVATRIAIDPKYRASYLSRFAQKLTGRTRFEAEGWFQDISEARRNFIKKNEAIAQEYRFVGRYKGQIVLFRQRFDGELDGHPFKPRHVVDYGWRRLTGTNVQVVYVAGDHGSCLAHPHVVELAKELRRVVAAAAQGLSSYS
jgi:thioesterase domain-containing protein/acyl carrier protein